MYISSEGAGHPSDAWRVTVNDHIGRRASRIDPPVVLRLE